VRDHQRVLIVVEDAGEQILLVGENDFFFRHRFVIARREVASSQEPVASPNGRKGRE